jgi:hypothetical protein
MIIIGSWVVTHIYLSVWYIHVFHWQNDHVVNWADNEKVTATSGHPPWYLNVWICTASDYSLYYERKVWMFTASDYSLVSYINVWMCTASDYFLVS